MSIKLLPGDVVAQIKSSVVINSLNNVVCGLLKNSLDAKATRVNVSLDYSRGNCSVEDDGIGILPSEFGEDGSLGQLHSTSKFPPRTELYGRHGVFLASVAALSLLSISSHHQAYNSHNSLSIHNSKILARHTPALPEQRVLTFPHGTRVTVRDLFGIMPVRVKHRAMQAMKGSSTRDWDQLVLDVLAVLIAWPDPVSLSIREASSPQTLTLRTRGPSNLGTTTEGDQVSRLSNLLQQASLFDVGEKDLWVSLGASAPGISVSGCVCLVPVATRRTQFISLGIEPLSNEGQNVLYEETNRIFANSAFGSLEAESDTDGGVRKKTEGFTARELKTRKGVDRWPVFSLTIDLEHHRANVETGLGDLTNGSEKKLSEIVDLLKAMFHAFLKKHQFRPKPISLSIQDANRSKMEKHDKKRSRISIRRGRAHSLGRQDSRDSSYNREMSGERSPVRPVQKLQLPDRAANRSTSPFDHWSRIKAGRLLPTFKANASNDTSNSDPSTQDTRNECQANEEGIENSSILEQPRHAKPSLFDSSGKLTRKPFEDVEVARIHDEENDRSMTAANAAEPSEKETFVWVNPRTNRASIVNSRTGFVLDHSKSIPQSRTSLGEPRAKRRLPKATESDVTTEQDTLWVADLLARWKNPVFELTETPIPRLPAVIDSLGQDPGSSRHKCNEPNHFSLATSHETSAMGSQGRLFRDNLRTAELIAQVDKKFILAKVQSRSPKKEGQAEYNDSDSHARQLFLVLIDQHAADERYRVESLMKEYFKLVVYKSGVMEWKPRTHMLERPLRFELSTQERDLFVRHCSYFGHWGIFYELRAVALQPKSKNKGGTELSVTQLPMSIAERCKSEPRLLIELLRKEAWKLNDEPSSLRLGALSNTADQGADGSTAKQGDEHSWVARFHGCPQGILDLINSRACRSAIMFNDPLSMEECAGLLNRVTDCAFPFQCAHGRPSMIPLLDLGGDIGDALGPYEEPSVGSSFVQGFKKWTRTL